MCPTPSSRFSAHRSPITFPVNCGIAVQPTAPTPERAGRSGVKMTKQELQRQIEKLEKNMREAARMMEYEYAAVLRDEIIRLRGEVNQVK